MQFLRIATLLVWTILPNTPLAAQEHHHHTQVAPTQPPGFEQYLKLWGLDRSYVLPLPGARPEVEGPLPLPRVRPSEAPHTHVDGPFKNPKFSEWGYRHAEIHDKGLVAKLQELTGGTCCNGPKSGECRVSSVDIPAGLVLVDGHWFRYDKNTKIVVMEELEGLRDGQESIALVCAGRTYEMTGWEGPPKRTAPTIYCIALSPQKT